MAKTKNNLKQISVLLIFVSVFWEFSCASTISSRQASNGELAAAEAIFKMYIDKLNWHGYWLEGKAIGLTYPEGKMVKLLFFSTNASPSKKSGFCSVAPALCVANSASPNANSLVMQLFENPPGLRGMFSQFAEKNYGDGDMITEPISEVEFIFFEKEIFFPKLSNVPNSILQRKRPNNLDQETRQVLRQFTCWQNEQSKPKNCTGSLSFAFYDNTDPYWFVLRSCSLDCSQVFQDDSIMFLTRNNGWWGASSGGLLNNPKSDVEKFKQKIERSLLIKIPLSN